MQIHGGCYCGRVRYEFDDSEILLSVYCHCTNCQRLTAGCVIHTIHVPESQFSFTGQVQVFDFVSKSHKHRHRCMHCGTQFASYNATKKTWSIWSSTIDGRVNGLPETVKATAHMFYETRVFDAADDLSKWAGYPDKSEQLG